MVSTFLGDLEQGTLLSCALLFSSVENMDEGVEPGDPQGLVWDAVGGVSPGKQNLMSAGWVGPGEQALNSTDGCGEQGKSMGDMGSGFMLVLIVRESEIIPLPSLSLLGTQ